MAAVATGMSMEAPALSNHPEMAVKVEPVKDPLKGVRAFVDSRSDDGVDTSAYIAQKVQRMGGSTGHKLKDCTHLVWKDGARSIVRRARKLGLLVVSTSWIGDCAGYGSRIPERPYLVSDADLDDEAHKRKRSLQPKKLEFANLQTKYATDYSPDECRRILMRMQDEDRLLASRPRSAMERRIRIRTEPFATPSTAVRPASAASSATGAGNRVRIRTTPLVASAPSSAATVPAATSVSAARWSPNTAAATREPASAPGTLLHPHSRVSAGATPHAERDKKQRMLEEAEPQRRQALVGSASATAKKPPAATAAAAAATLPRAMPQRKALVLPEPLNFRHPSARPVADPPITSPTLIEKFLAIAASSSEDDDDDEHDEMVQHLVLPSPGRERTPFHGPPQNAELITLLSSSDEDEDSEVRRRTKGTPGSITKRRDSDGKGANQRPLERSAQRVPLEYPPGKSPLRSAGGSTTHRAKRRKEASGG